MEKILLITVKEVIDNKTIISNILTNEEDLKGINKENMVSILKEYDDIDSFIRDKSVDINNKQKMIDDYYEMLEYNAFINGTKRIAAIRVPDYQGGWNIRFYEYENDMYLYDSLKDFEYVLNEDVQLGDTFEALYQYPYSNPEEYDVVFNGNIDFVVTDAIYEE